MRHVVILPYFCDEEIKRYKKIVGRMAQFPKQKCDWQFLLAASPRIKPSEELKQVCEQVAPTDSFQCPTQIFGYPEGPTAMFWDSIQYIQDRTPNDGGFGLWFESDMAATQPDWLDRLDGEWNEGGSQPLLMGLYVPEVYKHRLLKKKKLLLGDHVNGGACYGKQFAHWMPPEARDGVFDVVVYQHAKKLGKVRSTGLIDFSTNERVRRDLMNKDKVILHGFMQEKNQFVDDCVAPVTEQERKRSYMIPVIDSMELARRRLRVWSVRRGKRAMYENMLLAKERDNRKRAA